MSVSQKIIDYCENWGVKVSVVSTEDFFSNSNNRMFLKNPFNNTAILKKTILVDENIKQTKNPTDDRVLHELAHIVVKVAPNKINEFTSPYFALWFKMMQETNSKHDLMCDPICQKQIHSVFFIRGKDIYGAVDSFVPELIANGLLNNHNELTFNSNMVKANKSWLKN
jgi:hypothetical protein